MKKKRKTLYKVASFVPAILVMCMIFFFSSQTGEESANVSLKVSRYLVDSTDKCFTFGLSAEQLEQVMETIHVAVRKTGHVMEYLLLSLTVFFHLFVVGFRGKRLYLSTGIFCVLFALLDEVHQVFVADRGPSVKDVGIDSIGIVIGILLVYMVCLIKGRKRRKSDSQEIIA